MRKMDKELIDHIKDSLHTHEEAYIPGSWERFSATEEKKRRGFAYWPLWTAAAIIFVVGSVFFFQNNDSNNQYTVVKTSKPPVIKPQRNSDSEPSPKTGTGVNKSGSLAALKNATSAPQRNLDYGIRDNNYQDVTGREDVSAKIFSKNQSDLNNLLALKPLGNQSKLSETIYAEKIATTSAFNLAEIILKEKKTQQSKMTFEQLLEQDSRNNNLAKTNKGKPTTKWEPGVFVAPSMGNDNKVNMNYGFSLAYNLADKLSISSGIAYSALSTTSNPSAGIGSVNDVVANSPSASKAVAYSSASKSLESINANVRGINIPIELKYNISKKFYTGIGVSALAITNNRQNNNYIVSSAQNTAVANTFGITEQKMLIVTERVSEPQGESVTADKLIGFYNFSLGYKQKISKKNNFAVEPFLRLPMKTFSTDKLNLTNGGIRLKFDF